MFVLSSSEPDPFKCSNVSIRLSIYWFSSSLQIKFLAHVLFYLLYLRPGGFLWSKCSPFFPMQSAIFMPCFISSMSQMKPATKSNMEMSQPMPFHGFWMALGKKRAPKYSKMMSFKHPAKSKDTLCFWQLKLAIHTSIFHFSSSGDGDWNLLQVDGGLWWWMWWYPFWKDKASMTWYGGHHISYPSVTMSKNPGKETHPFHQKSKIKITMPMVSNTSKALVHAGIVVAIDNNTCKAKVSQHKTSPLQGSLCG